ncbi:MAG: carboxylating nicotinate-nucleotide diphosphorylase [Armatimonadetes bacterium]|nr:carboxylating nicotinate-nucleotide diphosphorylase [Armatimonadota bacterium]
MTGLDPTYIDQIVRMALTEDIGSGDITTQLTVPENAEANAEITAKQPGIIAGLDFVQAIFNSSILESPSAEVRAIVLPNVKDGDRVNAGDCIAKISGQSRTILTGERCVLNILQRMSGIATLTAEYVNLVSQTKARIVDTRKTTPGLRRLEKYAVTVGGGYNHRFGLSDGILIKDNHIAAAGSITAAVNAVRNGAPAAMKIEVEVTNLEQHNEAIAARADIIMLDNMSLEEMRKAVEIVDGKALLEASGAVNKNTVKAIAETGVDIISVGALTHSAPSLDISLNFIK